MWDRCCLLRYLSFFPLLRFVANCLYDEQCCDSGCLRVTSYLCTVCWHHRTSQCAGERPARSSRSTKTKVYILQTTYLDSSIIIYCSLYCAYFYYLGFSQNWITVIRLNPTRISTGSRYLVVWQATFRVQFVAQFEIVKFVGTVLLK